MGAERISIFSKQPARGGDLVPGYTYEGIATESARAWPTTPHPRPDIDMSRTARQFVEQLGLNARTPNLPAELIYGQLAYRP